jgi:hypothetical protein
MVEPATTNEALGLCCLMCFCFLQTFVPSRNDSNSPYKKASGVRGTLQAHVDI